MGFEYNWVTSGAGTECIETVFLNGMSEAKTAFQGVNSFNLFYWNFNAKRGNKSLQFNFIDIKNLSGNPFIWLSKFPFGNLRREFHEASQFKITIWYLSNCFLKFRSEKQ